jgi:hypothetical protein
MQNKEIPNINPFLPETIKIVSENQIIDNNIE